MILLNDFFFILQQEITSNSIKSKISFNKDHKILKGHFPGMPVVPGVCMVQIILEVMEKLTLKSLRLVEADSIKFLTVMVPGEYNEIELMINYTSLQERIRLTASIFSGTTVFFKLNGTLTAG